MPDTPSTAAERAQHWDGRYDRLGTAGVSWYQPEATVSLELIAALGVPPDGPLLDVGGGASPLAAGLVARGFSDVSVLDVSAAALRAAAAPSVRLITADLLQWRPDRRYALWHDRAVFHFLTTDADRARYVEVLSAALAPGGALVVGTFAADGPERCSGLPVCRYTAEELADTLGPGVQVIRALREEHTTPSGAVQPFTWVAGTLG